MLVYHIKYINEVCGGKYQSCLMLHRVVQYMWALTCLYRNSWLKEKID